MIHIITRHGGASLMGVMNSVGARKGPVSFLASGSEALLLLLQSR